PYTDEYTVGADRDLGQALKVSAVYTYRRDRYQLGTVNTARAYATTFTTRPDAGPAGVAGTPHDGTYPFLDRTGTGNTISVTNDPTSIQTYKGLELTASKRLTNRWQVLAGYTYARTTWVNFSTPNVATPNPNFAFFMNGPLVTNAYTAAGGPSGQ